MIKFTLPLARRLALWSVTPIFFGLALGLGGRAQAALPPVAAAAAGTAVILYNGALGGTPGAQGMDYLTLPLSASVTESFTNGVTTLDTTPQTSDFAGYFAKSGLVPALNRAIGYTVNFTTQVITETHSGSDKDGDGLDDRAGLSLIVLSSDKKGIELGFWPDEIWAQEDGTAEPPFGTLFTHAEGVALNTTARLITYTLTVLGDTYTLSADDTMILSGPLRDYSTFTGFPDPYETPNFIFIGDDTSSAKATIRLSFVSAAVNTRLYLPLILK